jgi:hypothetical protein
MTDDTTDTTATVEPVTLEEALVVIRRLRFDVAKYRGIARSQERKYKEAAQELEALEQSRASEEMV